MSLLKQWEEISDSKKTEEEYNAHWRDYFLKEQHVYESLLAEKKDTIKGTLSDLAKEFKMSSLEFSGFMSGINTSLTAPLEVETLEEDSKISVKIDFEKLLYNMYDAEAEWLYSLPQWNGILSKDKMKEIKASYNSTKTFVNTNKIGRNDPCNCGSGKKFKKCCGK